MVGTSYRMSLRGGRLFRMSGSCRVAIPDVREALPILWKWSGDHLRCPREDERLTRISGSGREALPDTREWSGGPPGCPEVFGSPSRMTGSGRESISDVREFLGGPPE